MNLDSIPVQLVLPNGKTFQRDDILTEARVDKTDLDKESELVGARIARYGYLASYFAHQKQALDDERKRHRAEFTMQAKLKKSVSYYLDGDVHTKSKPTEKDIENAWRLDETTLKINQQLADAMSSHELFIHLVKAHQSKSAQITNLQRRSDRG